MKKKISLVVGLVTLSLMLAACSPTTINYEGKVRSVSEIEEVLGDKLEVENPGLDIDVDIIVQAEE